MSSKQRGQVDIKLLKKTYYKNLYERFPAIKKYGDIKLETWAWEEVEKAYRRICKS